MVIGRWHRLMEQWGTTGHDDVYLELLSAYSEPHRHYHTANHIADCLAQFDTAASMARVPKEVEMALWFHDAVYKPTSSTNELKSADWATAFLSAIGATPEQCSRVHEYIMATTHATGAHPNDAAVVVDIDLSILGRERPEFEIYEEAIRREYSWVPGPLYRRKRVEILQSFLDRPSVFGTEFFRSRYEQRARENLQWALQSLRK